jgi:hypothetical protein
MRGQAAARCRYRGQGGRRFGRRGSSLPPAKVLHDFVVYAVDLLAALALVGKERCFLRLAHGRDVHVIGGMKAHSLCAEIDLVIIQIESDVQRRATP